MIVALALSVLLFASAPAAAGAPRLAPEETVFDFGTVERGPWSSTPSACPTGATASSSSTT
jgi:hypothetical protein